ncbi:MAG: sugar ABC transporter ATP-binding protein [Curvibacter sp.]|nr:sugar ABC transporter ATP-binding protein [Curvibacter sp.]
MSIHASPRGGARPESQAALLSARGLAKSFGGVPALRDGRLDLLPGSVHALCGGNGAGKSTFLQLLMGMLSRDAGEIRLRGRAVDFDKPADALRARISIITQELSPVPGMTVAENIYLGREPRRHGVLIDFPRLWEQTRRLLERLGFDLQAKAPMHSLSLAQTQLVEIAKAFSRDSEILIMDEPTSAIGEHETGVLFAAIRQVCAQGAGVIYVSHRLSEIFEIADHYTVFRDGCFVETGRLAEIDRRHLVRQIVGHELETPRIEQKVKTDKVLLDVDDLSRRHEFDGISLQLHAGEILGIYGLLGSGRSEFLHCLYGLSVADRGAVQLQGTPLPAGRPRTSIQRGLALVTEDRKDSGLVLCTTVSDNTTLAALPTLAPWGVIQRRREQKLVARLLQRLRVKATSPRLRVSALSGGNQQKVVLARCLATQPQCLLCDEPTRGIDEGAKREIYAFLDAFARAGGAVLLVSSEAPEVLDLSDRIAIFKRGRLSALIPGHTATQESLLQLAT